MKISIKTLQSEEFRPLLLNLGENLAQLGNLKKNETNIIDLQELAWVSPLAILPLAAILRNYADKGYAIPLCVRPANKKCASYLKTVHFYEGIGSSEELKGQKTYIPIIANPGLPPF